MQEDGVPCGELSLLTPIGFQSGDCGYCKGEDSSQRTPDSRASYYARSKSLCPKDYQTLMDRGWRRSGSLLYMPDASRSCCPHYTIRLPASEFKPSRDQRQALNRWNRYVLGEKYHQEVSAKYPKTKLEKKQANSTFDLIGAVHESELSHLKPDIQPQHNFHVTLEPDTFTEEKFALFANYQHHVHHENPSDITPSGFKRFLCASPLHRHTTPGGQKQGSYHQCYRLNGRLIALAVLDLLPHAVSGVYFIYHHDFEAWSFGKLSALRETALAREAEYALYYMGYYIHGCKKMRYKADYQPQYVLDVQDLSWSVLDEGWKRLMERPGYASLARERERKARSSLREIDAGTLETAIPPMRKDDSAAAAAPNAKEQNNDIDGLDNDEDDNNAILHPNPLKAAQSNLSLLTLGMPGLLTLAQLKASVTLDTMRVYLGTTRAGRREIHEMQEIVSWHAGGEMDPGSIKGTMAEFAAAVGAEVAGTVVADFSRG